MRLVNRFANLSTSYSLQGITCILRKHTDFENVSTTEAGEWTQSMLEGILEKN